MARIKKKEKKRKKKFMFQQTLVGLEAMVPHLDFLGLSWSRRQDGVEVREAGAGQRLEETERLDGGCCASRRTNKGLGQGEEATRK